MELLPPSDIALVAAVGASAMSNWLKRYDDFPVPLVMDSQSVLFDRGAIEAWLRAHGKTVREPPLASRLWSLLEGERSTAPMQQLLLALIA